MENQSFVLRPSMDGVNSLSITPQQSPKQNVASLKASEYLTSAGIIVDNIGMLAAAYDHPLTPDGISAYTRALMDLSPEQLHHGFTRAIKELKFWPRPAELREMCTGLASAMIDKLRIDEAWNWTVNYVETFGVPATCRWEIQGKNYNGKDPDLALILSNQSLQLATSAHHYEVTATLVPRIPALVSLTLISISGSVKMGLTRMKDALRVRVGSEGFSSKDSAYLRKDWDEYCARAIAEGYAGAANNVGSPLQLAGAVTAEFPVLQKQRIAVRIQPDGHEYRVTRLSFAEVTEFQKAGNLSEHLYEEALKHHMKKEEEAKIEDEPRDFNAIYKEPYSPGRSQITGPWPRMGVFDIEDGDGRSVVYHRLTMATGHIEPRTDRAVRFRAKTTDLYFEEYRRCYLDLGKVAICQGP